jgi:hypothetical protein
MLRTANPWEDSAVGLYLLEGRQDATNRGSPPRGQFCEDGACAAGIPDDECSEISVNGRSCWCRGGRHSVNEHGSISIRSAVGRNVATGVV